MTRLKLLIQKTKRFRTVAVLVLLPLTLTGCSLRVTPSSSSNGQSLSIWRQPINKTAEDRAFDTLVAGYKKQNPGVAVTVRSFASTEDYETAVLNSLAAGKGPDIWEIRNDELARHIDKLAAYPLGKAIDTVSLKKNYAVTIADEMVSDSKLYGMPIGVDPLVLYYNTAHFQEAAIQNPPTTWEEMLQDAITLTRKVGSNILRPGFALSTSSNLDRAGQITELIMQQFKTQMVDPAHRTATFDLYTQDPTNSQSFNYPGQNALRFMSGFSNPQSGYQTWDSNQPYSTQAFAASNLSMMINYMSMTPQLKAINPKLKFSFAPIPQRILRTFPRGDLPGTVDSPIYTARYRALVASKPWAKLTAAQQTAKTKTAWGFILYATSANVASAYDQSAYMMKPEISANSSSSDVSSSSGANTAQTIKANLVTWYKGHSPRTVDSIMAELTRAVTEGGAPVQETMTQAAQAVTGVLP